MALPTKTDLLTLDFNWRGQPFSWIEAKPAQSKSMDYNWRGQPFVVMNAGGFVRYYYDMIGQSHA